VALTALVSTSHPLAPPPLTPARSSRGLADPEWSYPCEPAARRPRSRVVRRSLRPSRSSALGAEDVAADRRCRRSADWAPELKDGRIGPQ
jgi:hypothetical protein